ncbi:hypothetical protein LOTGIDRAFT_143921 [Lottia gigantea]|uniref:Gem-associated protein 7 n=1 Tax=Lottia gigantea TaxID=225164 RepID=V4C4W0_LOTGI|nr:hypothetical protein LOTGIDRAFT_143921 [Lottia gigantea]ESO96619.1 hypothetical protein LOTGIDRAFT_143921 [Lottia gigantea]
MENNTALRQDQRTILREKFLRMLGGLSGVEAKLVLYEKATVTGKIGPTDVDFHHIQISNLQTPMGVIPDAILRTSDMISIKIDNISE